ncbi:hypothetical protein B0H10DRAFT_728404 [Mycena sp. CBHHK59/15]|nr:hypothetical protein B0H10DRAFT_728404 [Mycena sp. CBHHK59/15]
MGFLLLEIACPLMWNAWTGSVLMLRFHAPLPPAEPASLICPRSSPGSPSTSSRCVRQRAASADGPQAPTPVHAPVPIPVPEEFIILKRQDVPALVCDVEIAPRSQVYVFQSSLRNLAMGANVPYVRKFDLHANTVDTAASGIRALIHHLEVHQDGDVPFPLPAGVLSCSPIRAPVSFFRDGVNIQLGVHPNGQEVSFGPGPESAVLRRAVFLTLEDYRFWQPAPHSSWFVPVFGPSIEVRERTRHFVADASLFAIHCHVLGTGPAPISPWLMLAACFGRRAMLIPKQYLAALDPIAFDCLAPWLMLEPEDPIPTNLRHPLCQFLINHMDMQPSMIASPRTPDVHNDYTIEFTTKILLNCANPWVSPEFRAIQYGVDIPIGTSSFSMRLVSDNNVLPLLACMYDSQVRHVEDVTSHIDCSILMSATDGTTPYYGALFCLLLLRYLDGVGHPLELHGGVVGEDEWSKHINDPLCRAKLFLEAISDNDLLPAIESWQINLHFVGGYTKLLP